MRRATITLPDDLAAAVDRFTASEPAAPSLTSLVQAALRRFLADPEGSGVRTVMIERVLGRRAAIRQAAARHGASNVRLFGSTARGENQPDSDIDLLVSTETGRTLFDLARLRAELEHILEAPVDLVTDNVLLGEARDAILGEAIPL
jgi:predicted nucleotidyltransferase